MIQIDIEMPKCCRDCVLQAFSDLDGENHCIFTWDEIPYNEIERPENCPLIEVKTE